MVKALLIAWKDFCVRFKDRKGFMTMIVTPLILTAILGMALQGVMGEGESLEKFPVGIYGPDEDELATTFIDEVLPSVDLFMVKKASGTEELEKWMETEKVEVAIILPKEWSKEIQNVGVEILSIEDQSLRVSIVESMVKSFSEHAVATTASVQEAIARVSTSDQVAAGEVDMNTFADSLLSERTLPTEAMVKEETVGKASVSSMQYYAAAMSVMFLLFNATLGAKSLQQERSTATLTRLMATPTSSLSILLGKFLGTLGFAAIQFFIFFGATTLFFGVDWGEQWLQTTTIGLAYAFAVSGLAMVLAAFVKNEKTTDVINGVGVQIFAVLGGSMLPIYLFPDALQKVASITPNKWALVGFLDVMSGSTWAELVVPISVLFGIGICSVTVGIWRLTLRKEG